MGYKAYSGSYLMSLTKTQIIELLRVAEHNFFAAEEALSNSVKAGMEIAEKYDKAKELLKMAVEDFDFIYRRLGDVCEPMPYCDACPFIPSGRACNCEWRYTDEVKKLLNDEKINNVE